MANTAVSKERRKKKEERRKKEKSYLDDLTEDHCTKDGVQGSLDIISCHYNQKTRLAWGIWEVRRICVVTFCSPYSHFIMSFQKAQSGCAFVGRRMRKSALITCRVCQCKDAQNSLSFATEDKKRILCFGEPPSMSFSPNWLNNPFCGGRKF